MKQQTARFVADSNEDRRPSHGRLSVAAGRGATLRGGQLSSTTGDASLLPRPNAARQLKWWLALVLLAALNMRSPISGMGVVLNGISTEYAQTNWLAAVLGSVPLLAFGLVGAVAPLVARHVGSDRAILLAMAVLASASGLRVVGGWQILLVGTVVASAAIGVLNVLIPVAIRQHLGVVRGLAVGLYTMSIGLSAAAGAGASAQLVAGGTGWKGVLLIVGAPAVLACVAWLVPAITSAGGRDAGVRPSLLRSKAAWSIAVFFGLQSLAFYAALAWLPSILVARGLDLQSAGWFSGLTFAVEIPVALVVPWLLHRSSSRHLIALLTPIPLAVGFIGLLTTPAGYVIVWVVFLGLGFGAGLSTATVLMIDKASSSEAAARLSGMSQALGYLLAAGGVYMAGYPGSVFGEWDWSLAILAMLSVPAYFALRIAIASRHAL